MASLGSGSCSGLPHSDRVTFELDLRARSGWHSSSSTTADFNGAHADPTGCGRDALYNPGPSPGASSPTGSGEAVGA